MSSLVLDLGLPSNNGYLQGRKQAKGSAMGKDREHSCLRWQRMIINRRVGTLLAFFISALSLLMLTSRVSSPSSKPVAGDDPPSDMIFSEQHQNVSIEDIQIPLSGIPPPLERMESFQRHESKGDIHFSFSSKPPPHERFERMRRHANFSMQRIGNYQHMRPSISSDHPLPSDHPCQGFTLADKKRTGPRPCPVCYLPVEKAIDAMPMFSALQSSAIKQLSYVEELPMSPQGEKLLGTEFGGHPTLEDRWKSYQIQENMKIHCGYLWRRNSSFAISRHHKRFDVFEEAEANKAAGKYNNASINAQVDFYRSEGLVPYDRTKSFFPSDVPEGCVIIREHTPVTNLFTCLWFNEVDRFTSRDQLSFAVVHDMLMERIPFRLSMFLDCERRNFVVQEYHRDLLEQRKTAVITTTGLSSIEVSKPHGDLGVNVPPPSASRTGSIRATPKSPGRHRRGASSRRRMGSRLAVKST